MTPREEPARLWVVAHRHGNEVALLHEAESTEVDLIEVDLHLFRGKLDARHAKTVGPIPLLWDRKRRPRWNPPRQSFEEIMARAHPETLFYIDLKGWSRRLSRKTIVALESRAHYVVSTRVWWLLHPFRTMSDVTVLRSIGARWQLRWFLRKRPDPAIGVSIRRDLLTPSILTELRSRAAQIFVWGVASSVDARALYEWGVDGVIVDDLELARTLLATPTQRLSD